jgi:hypothetical protein
MNNPYYVPRVFTLDKSSLVEIHGITKNGNAIVTIFVPWQLPDNRVIMSKRNFNFLINNTPITGAIVKVEKYDLPIFKTLSF